MQNIEKMENVIHKKMHYVLSFHYKTEKLVDGDAPMSFSFHDVEEGLSFFI